MSAGLHCGLFKRQQSDWSRRFIILAAMLALSMCASAAHRDAGIKGSELIWSAALIPDIESKSRKRYWEDREHAGITFLDARRLLVHYVRVDHGQLSSRESPDVSSPFRLTAMLMDADKGKVLLTREWGARAEGTAVRVNRGGVLVRTGDTLRLLSGEMVEQQKMPIEFDAAERLIDWHIQVSPSRRSVLFNHFHLSADIRKSTSKYYVLDGETFEDRAVWEQAPAMYSEAYSVSDGAIAYVNHGWDQEEILSADFGDGKWHMVWKHAEEGCIESGVFALLTSTEFIYACREFSFVSNGKVQMREKFGTQEKPVNAKVSFSEDGRFVAISLARVEMLFEENQQVETLTRLRVVVYDLALKKRVQDVTISPLPKQYYDFAISPDGSKLAILNDRTVSVRQIPGKARERERYAGGVARPFAGLMRY